MQLTLGQLLLQPVGLEDVRITQFSVFSDLNRTKNRRMKYLKIDATLRNKLLQIMKSGAVSHSTVEGQHYTSLVSKTKLPNSKIPSVSGIAERRQD